MRRAETQHKPSRGERGFFLGTARRAAPRGVVAVLGVRFGGRFLRRTLASLSSLRGELQAGDAVAYHCTNHSNMWPLSSSAAEVVAAKAVVSIDVPADYKWVLLALVGMQPA